jgi:hypothetical protein
VDDRRQIQWIAVRGSQNLRNWFLNLRYMQRPFTKNFQNRRVLVDLHWGFYEAAEEIYKAILPYLRPDYPIRLTGHSLGGAIAVLLLMFLKEDGYAIERCVTFGQPKVTDQRGADQCQHLPLLRVVNHQDIVPLLPPGTPLTQLQGNYAHFGQEIYLHPERHFSDHCPRRPMQGFWLGLLQTLGCPQLANQKIKDHDLSLYLLALIDQLESVAPSVANLKQALAPLEELMPRFAFAH